jgi:hypothetical protein
LTPVTSDIQEQIDDTNDYIDNQISDVLDATKSHSLIKIGNETLTQTLLGYLTPVTSDIQQQFANVDINITSKDDNRKNYIDDEINDV